MIRVNHYKESQMKSNKVLAVLMALVASVSLHANDPFFNDPFGDDIFTEMMQMQRQMDRMFEQMHQRMQQRSKALISPIGTYKIATQSQFEDKGDRYVYRTDIPKSKENTIKLSVDNHRLTVDAKVVKKEETKRNGMVSYQSYMSMYQRSLSLPADADESRMKSAYKDGYLTITFKKRSGSTQRKTATTKKDTNQSK